MGITCENGKMGKEEKVKEVSCNIFFPNYLLLPVNV